MIKTISIIALIMSMLAPICVWIWVYIKVDAYLIVTKKFAYITTFMLETLRPHLSIVDRKRLKELLKRHEMEQFIEKGGKENDNI